MIAYLACIALGGVTVQGRISTTKISQFHVALNAAISRELR